jgi:porin
VFNGDPAPSGTGDPQIRDAGGAAFRLNGGVFWINELAYATSIPIGGDTLPGTYKIGAWYHNGLFADQRFDTNGLSLAAPASNGMPQTHRGNFGGYVIIDQLLRRNSGSSDQGLAMFARAGGDPSDRNLIEFHADAGLSDVGLLPGRDNDVAGIAMSYERISGVRDALALDINALTGAHQPPADFESALELSYQAQIAPWWVAQPDLQVILHPGARLPNLAAPRAPTKLPDALVLGMRTAISF